MTKTLLITALLLSAIACNESKTETATEPATVAAGTEATPAAAPHEYAVKSSYSSAFEIGDYSQADKVVELWKQYDDNTLEKGLDMFADTVTMMMADGWRYHGTKDSLMKLTKVERAKYSTVKSKIVAITPLKATDLNESWVIIYGTEYMTSKNKTDSSDLQENWRFNKDGKIDMMHSYRRKL